MMDGDEVQNTYNKLRDISELDDVVFRSNKGNQSYYILKVHNKLMRVLYTLWLQKDKIQKFPSKE